MVFLLFRAQQQSLKINELRPFFFLLQTLIREGTTWPLRMVRGNLRNYI